MRSRRAVGAIRKDASELATVRIWPSTPQGRPPGPLPPKRPQSLGHNLRARPLFKNVCPAIAHKPQFYSRLPVARLARPLIFRTKTPVADFFKDGDRTNFLRVHRTQGRRGFWRRQFPRAFRVDRSGSDRTRRARRVNYQGEIAVHYLLTEMQKSIAQSSSSPRL